MKKPMKTILAVALMMLPMLSSAQICITKEGRLEFNIAMIPVSFSAGNYGDWHYLSDYVIIFKEGGEDNFVSVDWIEYQLNDLNSSNRYDQFEITFSFDSEGNLLALHKIAQALALRVVFEAGEPKGFYEFKATENMKNQDYLALALSEWTPVTRTPAKQAALAQMQYWFEKIAYHEGLAKQINAYDYQAFSEAFACKSG